MAIGQARAEQIAQDYTAAWNSGDAQAVAGFFTPDGTIVINGGEPWLGREGVAAMAAGFYADIPDLTLTYEGARTSDDHALYLWSFTGTHRANGRRVAISGWEEWDMDGEGLITRSRGWFESADYARQSAPDGRATGE